MNLQKQRRDYFDSEQIADISISFVVSTVGKSPRVMRTSSSTAFTIENLVAFAQTLPAEIEEKLLTAVEEVAQKQRHFFERRARTISKEKLQEIATATDRSDHATVASAASRMSKRRWKVARSKSA